MIEIQVNGLDELEQRLAAYARQIPFATSKALNDVAFKVRAAEQESMRATFRNPKPWVLRQIRIRKSTKRELSVAIGTPAGLEGRNDGKVDDVLSPHITGQDRRPRKAERLLQQMGLLPTGWLAVPSRSVRLDQYGNITLGEWKKITALQRGGKLFVALPGQARTAHLSPGVYRRTGSAARANGVRVQPIVLFHPDVDYSPRFPWEATARALVAREMPRALNEAIDYAIRTAR